MLAGTLTDAAYRGGVIGLLAALTGCTDPHEAPPEGVMVVVQEQQGAWIRNFNPLLATGGARWPTRAGIYEPLQIYSAPQGRWVPWLGRTWSWSEDGRALDLVLRHDVRWSDGEAFAADDVAFTFELLREHPALDDAGVWRFLERVEVVHDHRVRFHFSKLFVPGKDKLAGQNIVPEHVWSHIEDPVSWANPDPVGTGPFTEVLAFTSQSWELGRNPHYWQELGFDAMRFPAMPSNEQINLALVREELDWTGTFVPAIERVFVEQDPEHNHYWFPLYGNTVFLYANTERGPWGSREVRQGLSMAIDRERLSRVAMHGYTVPADRTGLPEGPWRDPELAGPLEQNAAWAARILGEVDGSYELNVVSGWSDWVVAAQILARDLQAAGLDVRVRAYDFGAWFEKLTRGDFDLSLGWSQEGPSPYDFYGGLLGEQAYKPLGESASTNWHRYVSADGDRLLTAFEGAVAEDVQHQLMRSLQQVFVDELPAVPLFPSPSWGECRTERFVGWPSPDDPYARLSPHAHGEALLVMTRVRAR